MNSEAGSTRDRQAKWQQPAQAVVVDDDLATDLGDASFVECAVNVGYVVCGLAEQLTDHAIRLLKQGRP